MYELTACQYRPKPFYVYATASLTLLWSVLWSACAMEFNVMENVIPDEKVRNRVALFNFLNLECSHPLPSCFR